MSTLKKEFEYYLTNQKALVEKYHGKYIVVKGQAVIGVYDSEINAIDETNQKHEPGTFLVQKCEPGSAGHTQTFHSRVAFA